MDKDYFKKYYQQYKEKIDQHNKEYGLKHKNEIKLKQKEWRKNNKKRKAITDRVYQLLNKEKISKYYSEYYEKNKEIIKNRSKKHYSDNKENKKKYARNKSKMKITFRGERVSLDHNPRKGICSLCCKSVKNGVIKQTQLHHIKYDEIDPLLHTIELCVSCHHKQHDS